MSRHLRFLPEEGSLRSLGPPASSLACPDQSAERRPFQEEGPARHRLSQGKLPPGWRWRGYVPHFEDALVIQSLGFRLHDAVPAAVVQGWKQELAWIQGLPASDPREIQLRKLIAKYEDAGHGACWLWDPRIAVLMEEALLHFDDRRYRLIAWCVIPNHVHALVETWEEWPLAGIVHSWKSFTAQRANSILKRSGDFWKREYFDRFIRDDRHFANAVGYIEMNPVKAGLVAKAEDGGLDSNFDLGILFFATPRSSEVEHFLFKEGVTGSNLVVGSILFYPNLQESAGI